MVALRSLYAEYLRSLKGVEVEEYLDLWIFRPIAFLLVKLLQRSPVTPNQLSLLGLGAGVAAGLLFARGDADASRYAALAYFVCNVLDCADGQLARLTGTKSFAGYILDGVIDHLSGIAVFLGIGCGLMVEHPSRWIWLMLTLAALVCVGWWCAVVERKRLEWMQIVYQQHSGPEEELAAMQKQARRWKLEGIHRQDRALIVLYAAFRALWRSTVPPVSHPRVLDQWSTEQWARYNYPVLRMALLTGPTMHSACIVLAGLFHRLDLYVLSALVVGNGWGLVVLLTHAGASRKLESQAFKAV
jgi:phosphatidylglycerophosphate synthase